MTTIYRAVRGDRFFIIIYINFSNYKIYLAK